MTEGGFWIHSFKVHICWASFLQTICLSTFHTHLVHTSVLHGPHFAVVSIHKTFVSRRDQGGPWKHPHTNKGQNVRQPSVARHLAPSSFWPIKALERIHNIFERSSFCFMYAGARWHVSDTVRRKHCASDKGLTTPALPSRVGYLQRPLNYTSNQHTLLCMYVLATTHYQTHK